MYENCVWILLVLIKTIFSISLVTGIIIKMNFSEEFFFQSEGTVVKMNLPEGVYVEIFVKKISVKIFNL